MDNVVSVVSDVASQAPPSDVQSVSVTVLNKNFVPDEAEVWSEDALDMGVGDDADGDIGPSSSSLGEALQDEYEDEDDYEDIEPRLKYERLGNDLTNIFKKDSASCIAVNSRFLVVGSHWGMIYVLDHLGNAARGHELQAHAVSVNQISLDSEGDYIASCSDDGRVVVHGWYSSENSHNLNFDRPVKSVALDPNYFKPRSGRKFLTGDEQLILHEKAFLSMQKQTVLHSGDGLVRTIKWNKENFVAYATDTGVRVVDMNERRTISLIKRDHDVKYRPELLRCHICWQDTKTLLIGWADTIKICVIRRNREPPSPYHDSPQHLVEIVSMFSTDFFVCGIAPLLKPGGGFHRVGDFGTPHLVVLSVAKEDGVVVAGPGGAVVDIEQNGKRPQECSVPARGQRPLLRIIEPKIHDYVEISTDILTVRNYSEYKMNDYHLDCLIDEGLFFIVSPKDVVVGKPRDADDHIDWLLERCKFEEALNTVEASGKVPFSVSDSAAQNNVTGAMLTRHTVLDVGVRYLDHLFASERFEEAAKNMPKILGRQKTLWENEAYRFASANQLKVLAPFLPKGEDFRLDPIVYEMVLYDFLKSDSEGFMKILRDWPDKLYNIVAVINAVLDNLIAHPDDQVLLQALAHLYSLSRQFRKALDIYLKLRHKDVFDLIGKYELVDSIKDLVPGLMELDVERAVRLFLDNLDKLQPDVVVRKLNGHSFFLYKYLNALYQKDGKNMKKDYHGRLVDLYSKHDPEKLLPFLQSSSLYSLQEAFAICKQENLYHEMVYLLTRMGNTRQALKLIMENLEEVNKAIDFCKEHDDRDLWHDLIQHSLDKPKFIAELLLNIGTHVDPLILIRRIKDGLEIPGLRDALVKILRDYKLQVALQEGFQSILVSDCFSLLKRLVVQQNRAVSVHRDQVCHACQRRLLGRRGDGDSNAPGSVVVFFCRHTFHADCSPNLRSRREVCSLCRSAETRSSTFGVPS